jgi:hypothetical protein
MPTRAQDIVSLLRGHQTAAELAARHGVSEAEVLAWKDLFLSGLEARTAPASRRWLTRVGAGALVVGVAALGTQAWAATCTQTLTSPLVTLCPNSPALATDVNGNFGQLVTWIQGKVGTVGVNGISASSIAATGSITAGGGLGTSGNLSVSGNTTITGNLTVQGSAMSGYNTGYSTGTNYVAATDGFVVAGMYSNNDGARCWIHGNVDGVMRANGSIHFYTGSDAWVNDDTITFPVKKGSTWNIQYTPTSGGCTVYIGWVALNP